MSQFEAWFTLIAFVVIVLILGYGVIFDRLPEPTQGWECNKCHKKVIGMKSQVEKAKWDTEYPYLCPGCRVE